jgi:hypothetical protein
MENSCEIAYIYALIDPRNDEIRYIGKTIYPKKRLSLHISECKRDDVIHYRSNWIKKLLNLDMKPLLRILKVCSLSEFEKYEMYYIDLYKENRLTNSDETGQGNIGRKKEVIDRIKSKTSRKVYQYNLDGIFLNEYKSVREASRLLNLSHSNISRCCNYISKHCGGFIFRYEKSNNINPLLKPNAVKKSVIEIDEFGNKINEWVSIMECSRFTGIDSGGISRVCNCLFKSIKGRYFKFS